MKNQVTVYYDGLCRLCSREINHYRGMRGAEALRFIDITSPDFDAPREGVDPVEVHKTMHVRDASGRLHLGVDAFICIWDQLPSLRFLVPVARTVPIHWVLRGFYAVFASVRPWLPRKSCESSPYCESRSQP